MDITIQFCVAFCVGLFGGIAVDQWLHTSPWGILIGGLAGLGMSVGVIIKCIVQEKARLANAPPLVIKKRPRHPQSTATRLTDAAPSGGGTLLTLDDLNNDDLDNVMDDGDDDDDEY